MGASEPSTCSSRARRKGSARPCSSATSARRTRKASATRTCGGGNSRPMVMSERRQIRTPWDAGAPALSLVPVHNRRFPWAGWVPTRRQILAGFHDPETGRDEEGQISRVLREFRDQGIEPTLDELARRLAIDVGDPDLIAILLGADVLPTRTGRTSGTFDARRYHQLIARRRARERLSLTVLLGGNGHAAGEARDRGRRAPSRASSRPAGSSRANWNARPAAGGGRSYGTQRRATPGTPCRGSSTGSLGPRT